MLRRYSGISSSASGVPCASSSTAVRSLMAVHRRVFPDELYYLLHVFDRCIGDNAVAEVEDMSGAAPCLIEDLAYSPADQLRLGEQCDGVEIALHCARIIEVTPRCIERNPPVKPEDVRPGLAHGRQQARRVHAEVDHRNAHGLNVADESLRRGQYEFPIVLDAQRTGPAVEYLDYVRTGFHLLLRELAQHFHQLVQQSAPRIGIAIHQCLGVDIVARSTTFDHVAGKCEGCAAESDDAEPILEVRNYALDGFSYIAQLRRAVGAQACNVFDGTNRGVNHRAFAGLELEVQSHAFEGKEQIGEDDRG